MKPVRTFFKAPKCYEPTLRTSNRDWIDRCRTALRDRSFIDVSDGKWLYNMLVMAIQPAHDRGVCDISFASRGVPKALPNSGTPKGMIELDETVDNWDFAEPSMQGLAAGGPADGQTLSATTPKITVPIKGPGGFGLGTYEFKFGMWIWQGHWPPKPK